jgi:hypothetical protein
MSCEHLRFNANVEVNRLQNEESGPIVGYQADVRVHCTDCGTPFQWIGLASGLMPGRPTVSMDMTELRAPIVPVGEMFAGPRLPGFLIREKGA